MNKLKEVIAISQFPSQNVSKNNDMLDVFVKRELNTIVLALLAKEPMCGRELKLAVFKHFNILLSSGTLYPLLHELEKENLLQCHNGVKTKTYRPTDEKKIKMMIYEHIAAKNHLNAFLEKTITQGD
ncbi:PadR family transcriptional regulator [Candidatus Woesearchaeota archaeon]|nr:PadR family transcriptional regulator [Candidatus Woesearchaeota archaeon]